MKKVIFCTNLPSPYRVDFFNEFGKYCDLTVLYERHSSSERNAAWKGTGAENFKEVYLDLQLVGVDRSKGPALKNYIKEHLSDVFNLNQLCLSCYHGSFYLVPSAWAQILCGV